MKKQMLFSMTALLALLVAGSSSYALESDSQHDVGYHQTIENQAKVSEATEKKSELRKPEFETQMRSVRAYESRR